MPTYVCSAATGPLTLDQKAEIVRSITAIHHEETGAPRYLVQVIFYNDAPSSHYIAGRPAAADQIWVRMRNSQTSACTPPSGPFGGAPRFSLGGSRERCATHIRVEMEKSRPARERAAQCPSE